MAIDSDNATMLMANDARVVLRQRRRWPQYIIGEKRRAFQETNRHPRSSFENSNSGTTMIQSSDGFL